MTRAWVAGWVAMSVAMSVALGPRTLASQVVTTAAADSGLVELLRPYQGSDRPGVAVAVVREGGVFTAAVGMADIERGERMTTATAIDIASVSKQFTAFGIALLETGGQLSSSDPAAHYIPALGALGQRVELRHLIHHTSGLKDYHGLAALAARDPAHPGRREDMVRLVAAEGALRHEPGAQFIYSNTGYLLLGLVIESVTGESLSSWLRASLFDPAGLASTRVGGAPAVGEGVARGYVRESDGRWVPVRGTAEVMVGPGGVRSTADDLARWSRELMAGELGGPAVHERIRRTTTLNDGAEVTYAYGWDVGLFRGVLRLHHSGSAPGIQTGLSVYPDHGIAVVILSNGADPTGLGEDVAELYLASVLEEEGRGTGLPPGAVFVDSRPPDPPPESRGVAGDTARYSSFAGRYRLEEAPDLVVTADHGRLFLSIDLETPPVELFPVPGDRYRFVPAGWDVSFRPSSSDGPALVLHLTESSVRRGPPRDVAGHRVTVPTPSADDYRALEGCFAHAGLGVTYRVLASGAGLALQHPRLGVLPLRHVRDDTYAVDDGRASGLSRAEFRHALPADLTSPVVALRLRAVAFGVATDFAKCSS